MAPLAELDAAYDKAAAIPCLQARAGRPAQRLRRTAHAALLRRAALTEELGGAQIYLKREDLLHTGAHKINNALGQCLLAKRMGKKRIIAETGAGQHGVATATVCALLRAGVHRLHGQRGHARARRLNVARMRLLGAEVVPVDRRAAARSRTPSTRPCATGSPTSAPPTTCSVRRSARIRSRRMVRDFHRVIGDEARAPDPGRAKARLPDLARRLRGRRQQRHRPLPPPSWTTRACGMIGVEAGGRGTDRATTRPASQGGDLGVLHGTRTYVLQDDDGQIAADPLRLRGPRLRRRRPGARLAARRRAGSQYTSATDDEALAAFHALARTEGILPALESLPRHRRGGEAGAAAVAQADRAGQPLGAR